MVDYGLVSIITPSYNSSDFIVETIEAIEAQTYMNWELLITDDCSNDNSCEIIERYARKDNRIKLFRLEQNSGAGVARNFSIKIAQGRFIAFCDSDDCWYPKKLEKQLAFMIDHEYDFSYTSYDTCNEKGDLIGCVKCLHQLSYLTLIRDNGIGCLTSIYNAEKIGKMYMPTIRKRQDWGLWLNIIKKTKYAYGLQDRLAIYRIRRDSISSNKISMLRYNFNLYHQVEGFSAITSFILLVFYFLPYYFYKKMKQKRNYQLQKI